MVIIKLFLHFFVPKKNAVTRPQRALVFLTTLVDETSENCVYKKIKRERRENRKKKYEPIRSGRGKSIQLGKRKVRIV